MAISLLFRIGWNNVIYTIVQQWMQNWDKSTPYSNIVVYINDITKREPGLVPLTKAQFSTSCNRQGRGHGQTLDNTAWCEL